LITGLPRLLNSRRQSTACLEAFHAREDGSVAIEYGLIAAFVVAVIIVALVQLGADVTELPLPALNTAFDEALS
jgi:Flp pilus assembly pilin Flp